MINQQLLDFIKQQLQTNVPKEKIIEELLANGWNKEDVHEGFNNLNTPNINMLDNRAPIPEEKKRSGGKIFLIILLIILLGGGAGLYYFRDSLINLSIIEKVIDFKNKILGQEEEIPIQTEEEAVIVPEEKNFWILDSKSGLIYNPNWVITPETYRTPAQEKNGEPPQIVGYRFTLPNGNVISWGGYQSDCSDKEFPKFEYGISTLTCLKETRVNLGLNDVGIVFSKEGLEAFGDFVLKNQEINTNGVITQEEAEALVYKTWSDCSLGDCGDVSITVDKNNIITAIFTELSDSTSQTKKEVPVIYQNGEWLLGQAITTQACHRGHSDGSQGFSSSPCI